jgi:hypothetical protein
VIQIPQIRGTVFVPGDAVLPQGHGVADPQPAPDQNQRDQPVMLAGHFGEITRVLQLGHDVFTQCPGLPGRLFGIVLGVDLGSTGQIGHPSVAAHGEEEGVELALRGSW